MTTYEVGLVNLQILFSLLLVGAPPAGRSRGQGGALDRQNDLDAGEDRQKMLEREGLRRPTELVSQTLIRGLPVGSSA